MSHTQSSQSNFRPFQEFFQFNPINYYEPQLPCSLIKHESVRRVSYILTQIMLWKLNKIVGWNLSFFPVLLADRAQKIFPDQSQQRFSNYDQVPSHPMSRLRLFTSAVFTDHNFRPFQGFFQINFRSAFTN